MFPATPAQFKTTFVRLLSRACLGEISHFDMHERLA
jgi:hypothetical protein